MKILKLMMVFLGCILLITSCAKKKTDSKEIAEDQNEEKFDTSKDSASLEDDAEFAVDVADAGMLEVRLGELAQSNGASEKVKEFGRMMVTDHSKANEELKTLASQKNISLPGTLSDKSQKRYNDLAEKRGKDFDKDYTDAMVKDHKDVLSKFKKEADEGKDAELKAWASANLPTLQHHLSMAEAAEKEAKNN